MSCSNKTWQVFELDIFPDTQQKNILHLKLDQINVGWTGYDSPIKAFDFWRFHHNLVFATYASQLSLTC